MVAPPGAQLLASSHPQLYMLCWILKYYTPEPCKVSVILFLVIGTLDKRGYIFQGNLQMVQKCIGFVMSCREKDQQNPT